MNIIDTILEWPVIIQGALGSFLFWLLLTLGQKIFNYIHEKISSEKNTANSFGAVARQQFHEGNYNISQIAFFMSLYGALHYLIKAILVIFIAQIMSSVIYSFSIVGYLIGLYFIYRSLSYVPHFSSIDLKPTNKNDTDNKS